MNDRARETLALDLLGVLYGSSTSGDTQRKTYTEIANSQKERRELEPIPVDFGLRISSFGFSKDNASDMGGISLGGRNLQATKSDLLGHFAFEHEANRLGRGLGEVLPNADVLSLRERPIDYVGSDITPQQILIPTVSKITQGDSAVMNGMPIQSSRGGFHIETKYLPTKDASIFIKNGYPLYSAAIPEDGTLLFMDKAKQPILEPARLRYQKIAKGPGTLTEPITLGTQAVLWDNPKILDNENILSWLAYAFDTLQHPKESKQINLPLSGDVRECTLMAQAVAHMLGRPLRWHINPVHMKYFYPKELGFGKDTTKQPPMIPGRFKNHIATMRSIFAKPWPEAHHTWTAEKSNFS